MTATTENSVHCDHSHPEKPIETRERTSDHPEYFRSLSDHCNLTFRTADHLAFRISEQSNKTEIQTSEKEEAPQ